MKRIAIISGLAVSSALFISAAALACDGEGGKGGPMTKWDTNSDGKVTQAEMLASWSARFDAEDTNKDGTVTDAEREAAHTGHMKERLSAMDTNKNGSIEKAEAKGPMERFFDKIDADNNGALSSTELSAHKAQFEKDHPRPEHKDGHKPPATKAELTAKVSEHFKRMDQNGDGVLSGDELAHGHHGRRHGHHGPDAASTKT